MSWIRGLGAVTLFVDDVAAARRFYTEVFELPVHFEDEVSVVFAFGPTLVNVLHQDEAPELIAPAPVATPDAGARVQLTLEVADVDATAALVRERGATLVNGPLDRPWGVRTALVADPAGHLWELAAPIRR